MADIHISPRTVAWLRSLGHDVTRVNEALTASATDRAIIREAVRDDRTIVTQDLDFSAIVAVSGRPKPSVISLRLSSSNIDYVNQRLQRVLPTIEESVTVGALITIEDALVRTRGLPLA